MNKLISSLALIVPLLIACSGPKTDSTVNNLVQRNPEEQRIIYSLAEICSRALVEQAKLDSSSHVSLLTHLKELEQFDQHLYEAVSGSSQFFMVAHMSWNGNGCPCFKGCPPPCCPEQNPTFASSVAMKALIQMKAMEGDSVAIEKQTINEIDLFTLGNSLSEGEYLIRFESKLIRLNILMHATVENGVFKLRP